MKKREGGGRESREILNSQPETPLLSPVLVATLVFVLSLILRQHSGDPSSQHCLCYGLQCVMGPSSQILHVAGDSK